jgi:50S ribosomal subunit-associated GTPase HflX
MDIRQAGVLAVAIPIAVAVASAVMWAGCRWWYGRQLAVAAHRLQKLEKARVFSQQQTAQARQQIGLLKAELDGHQQAALELEAAKRRAAQLEEAMHTADRERERERDALPEARMPIVSAHGFADTQILPD